MGTTRDRSRSGRRASGALRAAVLTGAVLLGGCLKEPTEIVVVVDTDLKPFTEFDVIQFQIFGSASMGGPSAEGTTLPATLGVVPVEFGPQQFDVMAVATKDFNFSGGRKPLITRRVSNIRFVPDERRAVLITLLRECMCVGTNCNLDPPCNDVTEPKLLGFDEDNIPHL